MKAVNGQALAQLKTLLGEPAFNSAEKKDGSFARVWLQWIQHLY